MKNKYAKALFVPMFVLGILLITTGSGMIFTNGKTITQIPELYEKNPVEDSKEYPVSFNGKVRFKIELPLSLSNEEVEKIVLEDERTIAQLNGNAPKKIIVVTGKIINVVA